MTDVFISYKKEDVARVEPIARALANAGYDIWWDHRIPPGRSYRDVIGAALSTAKCVIVVWSKLSANAQWVLDEADEGKRRNVLLPLLIDDVEIPYGFRQIEAARLVGWSGDTSHTEWANMLASVAHFVGRRPGGAPKPLTAASAMTSAPRSGGASASPPQRGSNIMPIVGAAAAIALAGGGYFAWRAGLLGGAEQAAPVASEGAADPGEAATEGAATPTSLLPPLGAEYADPRPGVLVPGDAMQTFFASGYVFCDAKLVADYWGTDIGEAKLAIGQKILNGIGEVVPDILTLSRNAGFACAWVDTGYQYEDAEALAALWGLPSPSEAKFRAAQYLTFGQGSVVERALGR